MRSLFAAAALSGLATLAGAADLDASHTEVGRITAEIDGVTHDLVITRDADGDVTAGQKQIMGQLSINLLGSTVQQDGTPGKPMVQVTLMGKPDNMRLLSAEMFDEQGYDSPLVMVPGGGEGGDGAMVAFAFEDDVTTGRVEGDFLRLTGYMSEARVADGATPLPATITWEVALPPLGD